MVIATQAELFGIAFAKKMSLLGPWANNFSVGFEAPPISQSRMLNGCHYGKWVNVRSKKCWCDIYLIVLSWSFSKFVSSMKYTALTIELQKNWCRLLKVHLKTQDNFVFVLFLCFLVAPTKCSIILLCAARAFTGRRNSHSGRGEDFLSRQPIFFTETAVIPERKVEKSFPRWEINRHVKG